MRITAALLFLALAGLANAQPEGVVAELEPMVVSGTFQLQLVHPDSDPLVQAIGKEIVERAAQKEAHERAGVFEAKFWDYIPIKFGLVDEMEFFAPSYSTSAYRKAEVQLRASEKNALIAP